MSRKLSCLTGLVLTLFAGTAMADITSGLVGRWTLTDGSGNVAADRSGNGNDGTIQGNATWVADSTRGGLVMVFDGTSTRIDFGPLFTFQNASWSISLWIKTPPSVDRVPLWGKTVADGKFTAGERDIEITGTPGTWGSIIDPEPAGNLAINGNSMGGAVTNQSAISLDDDAWHLVTLVHDDSVSATDIALYIDGVAQPKGTATMNNNNKADTGNVYLGFANASGAGTEGYFVGRMSDLRLYNRAVTPEEVLGIQKDSLVLQNAAAPSPRDGATDVPRDGIALSWKPGTYAAQHDLYLGSNFTDVNTATTASTSYRGRLDTTSLALGRLNFGTTYSWRVDEVNAPPDNTIFKGKVWNFTTEPVAYPVGSKTITVTASSADANQTPENTINGSGLANDLHSNSLTDMWLTAPGATGPVWIQYEFDRVLRLNALWVWNQNGPLEPMIGFGVKDVTIEYSTDGATFQTLKTTQFARATGQPGYTHGTTVDLQGVAAKYVKLIIQSNWGGLLPQYGLSEVRFFSVPVFAREPSLASGKTGVSVETTLSWRAGREASQHQVLLGTDPNSLTQVGATQTPSFTPALNLDTTYYWKIVEVNNTQTPSTWTGDLWNFKTEQYSVVDDFESYTDNMEAGQAIFQTWGDGFGTTTNGAVVGYPLSPFAERTIINSGKQSMPLGYDNTTATTSEATRTFTSAKNWSRHGIKGLTLRFYGDPNNAPQQMYVKINSTKVLFDGAAADLRRKAWQMWYIDLTAMDVTSVMKLSIGFDRVSGVGGKGKVFIDDIRLYSYPRSLITPVDPGTAGLQVQYQFEGNATDSSSKGRNGTLKGAPTFVAGKIGQAISLNGTADYVNVDGYKGILADANGVQQPLTLSAWIKTATNGRDIIAWGTNAGGQRMNFRVDTVLRVEHGSGNIRGTNGPSLIDNEWHHVAATVPLGGTLPDTRLYVDGADVSAPASATAAYALKANIDVVVGQGGTQGSRFFLGLIDDARIYDRVLSAAEIAFLAGRPMPFDKPF